MHRPWPTVGFLFASMFAIGADDPTFKPGDEAVVYASIESDPKMPDKQERGTSFGAADPFAYTSLSDAIAASDAEGVLELIEQRRVIKLEAGTKLKVIKHHQLRIRSSELDAFGYELRIMSGKYKGQKVFLPTYQVASTLEEGDKAQEENAKNVEDAKKRAKDPKVMFGKAMDAQKRGDKKAALEIYREIVRLHPDTEEADESRKRIKSLSR